MAAVNSLRRSGAGGGLLGGCHITDAAIVAVVSGGASSSRRLACGLLRITVAAARDPDRTTAPCSSHVGVSTLSVIPGLGPAVELWQPRVSELG